MIEGKNFVVDESAIARIKELLKKEENRAFTHLRIKVLGGGCSGFQYSYDLDNNRNGKDSLFADGLVVVDDISLPFISSSILKHEEEIGGSRFAIENPNATAKCGCGNSFSV
jgi:iron-sulfur cluster insertion protein